MSWIKKIIGKLSDKEEQYNEFNEEDTETLQPQSEKKKLPNKSVYSNQSREVEARMTYQYPKGNFRFPLISDQESNERPRASRERKKAENEKSKTEKVNVVKEPVNVEKKKQIKTPVEKVSESTPKLKPAGKKVEKGNNRPFRPTEIPSPIYGFKSRPAKKNVEFELKEFLHNDAIKLEALEKANPLTPSLTFQSESKDVHENVSEEIQDLKGYSLSPDESVDKEKELEPFSTEKTNVDVFYETSEVEIQENTTPQKEERISLITETEEQTEVDSDERHVEEPSTINDRSINSNEEVLTDKEEHTAEIQENATPQKEERISLITETEELTEVDSKERNVEEPSAIKDPSINSNEEVMTDNEEPAEAIVKEEEPPRRKRSHLPFNVLMLKQDKRQMNNRQKPSGPTSNSTNNTKVNEGNPPTTEYSSEGNRETKDTAEEKSTIVEPSSEPSSFENREETSSAHEVQGEEAVKSYSELSSHSKRTNDYVFPEMDFLMPPVSKKMSEEWLEAQRNLLNETLHNFNVRAKVVNVTQGPSVTRFEVQPEPGVKVNKITNLADDIKLSLAARDIRIEAPIPGKHTIGIEVPNRESRPVCISEVIASPAFQNPDSPLTAALGLDISGQPIVTDLSKMPHGLIAGATGSGKSVCINSILVSLLYKATPDELKMLLIDPKMVELAPYNRIPHLVSPVITDVKAATAALKWAVEEMERRYELFAHTGVRDIKRFNELAKRNRQFNETLPYLVIVIDELADLMMMSPADVEEAICRIAQKARACGIHLIIATQRPSVDVITGLIKANVPTRVAFSVSSSVDSRTIIDGSGAERLLGKGDMLFLENGSSKPVRLQGTFVSDDEIDDIINHVREQREPEYLFQQDELIKKAQVTEEEDELFLEACEFVVDQGGASASSLQRRFRIGYNRAARLMEMMENNGIISESRGSKPRDVLISESELETLA
ncbi:DNA translocase FtsK [Rossellomorea aquimaris]|uniref:DNA translocase FtsK n=1 Tax=Rossellomorea aquimaris TaxID=189382 RepID=UPI000AA058E8|nr:DNA translocase FtsK [Rossellomorea aquimaris]